MLRMRTTPVFFIFILIVALQSCIPQKQVRSTKSELTAINSKLEQDNAALQKLESIRQNKERLNEIDDTTTNRIGKFIRTTKTEIDTLVKNNSIIIGETVIDKNDWERLRNALSFSRNSSKRINDKILFLSDLISRNLVVKMDQDVLFEPGQYRVSPAVAESITKQFEPAAREIDLFTKKYPDFPLSLVITAKGYSDGTTIPQGGQLYRDLKQRLRLSTTEPDNRELNKELSRARAEAVKLLFQKFAGGRTENKIFSSKVLYLYEGKGEMYPDPKITDYKTNDLRRRVVLLFWSVFPE